MRTDLTKKNQQWKWKKEHQAKFEDLKQKLANLSSIGVPRSSGEMILVTDASDIGGGATLFQWQTLEPSQIPCKRRWHF